MTWSAGNRLGSRPAPRFTRQALAAIFAIAFLFLAYATYVIFVTEIGNAMSGVQEDYKVDGYYYIYLAKTIVAGGPHSLNLYDAAQDARPNASSGGIVFLSAVVLSVVRTEYLVPFAVGGLLLLSVYRLYGSELAAPQILWLPLSGLFPYFGIPSKELFFVVGFLLLIAACLDGRGVLLALIGALLMFLARPEGFYIFGFSIMLWASLRHRVTGMLFLGAVGVGYFLLGREALLAMSLLTQAQAEMADVHFCQVGPLQVCVSELGGLEHVYLARLLSLIVLPVKWIADLVLVFKGDDISWTECLVRLCNVVHMVWVWAAWKASPAVSGRASATRRAMLTFALVYWLVYGSILFFQPSRQAVLASTLAAIALLVRSAPANARAIQAGIGRSQPLLSQ